MKSSALLYKIIITIIVASLIPSLLALTLEARWVYETTSFGQTIQQNQHFLQSSINKDIQQKNTDIISNINNSNSNLDNTSNNNSQIQNTTY